MGSLRASLLPPALGVALSPLAIIAIIVVLLSRRPVANGVAFLVGWVLAVVVGLAASYAVIGAL